MRVTSFQVNLFLTHIALTMEKKQRIYGLREKLDNTLASHSISGKESIRKLVRNQLPSSPSEVQEKRVTEVSDLLDILRSASGNDFKASKGDGASHGSWKLKQDKEEYRVMYREGPPGTPFHTLVAEGYADAPVDVCLCVGWEVSMYDKWWPQIDFPPFKVIKSCCLKKVRIGEHISLVRVKVPWPLSEREVVLNYFELEYFEDDLVIVLLNSISDTENVDELMQGYMSKGTVRMDLIVGGFAIKKITSSTSYFRTVGNIDIKLDFAPPSLINFISRQLLGSACKLFQKTVASVAKGGGDFGKALEDPLYVRVREHLSHHPTPGPETECENSESHVHMGTSV